MARLRELFEALTFTDVSTIIASGNVVFSTRTRAAPTLERRIEEHLLQALGYEVTTFLRSPPELARIAASVPFPTAAPLAATDSLSVIFLKTGLSDTARAALMTLETSTDTFRAEGREAYWLCRGRTSDSTVTGKRLEKALAGPVTVRNATTVRKIAAAASA